MQNLIQSVLILMAVLMSTRGAEEVVYTQVGDSITLKPQVMDHSQKYYWHWSFGNVELASLNPYGKHFSSDKLWKDKLSLSDDSLTINNIQQEHFGKIVCDLRLNRITKETTNFHILKISVTMKPPSPLLPGEYLSLACDAETQNNQRPQIHWLNPQGMVYNQFPVQATRQHHGQWTCVVINNGKENKAKVSVTVVDLSPAPSRPQYTSKVSPLNVPCSIPDDISWEQIKARDIQEVHWDFFPKSGSNLPSERLFSLSLNNSLTWNPDQNKGLKPAKDPKTKNLSLTKRLGREEGRGDYVCTLKFKSGRTLSSTVHVEVMQIVSSPGTDLISGQQVNLTCSFGHPLPSDLQLKWTPPARSSLIPDPHRAHLILPAVWTGDGGRWKCELQQNTTLLAWAVIDLKIEPKLSLWMLAIICSVTVIVILLLIFVIILYRRRQRKRRHLRHRLCQCKNPKPKGFYRT